MTTNFQFTYTRNLRLTGRVRFAEVRKWRTTYVVVEVEETWEKAVREAPVIHPIPESAWHPQKHWRLAQPLDMADASLRWVVDGAKS